MGLLDGFLNNVGGLSGLAVAGSEAVKAGLSSYDDVRKRQMAEKEAQQKGLLAQAELKAKGFLPTADANGQIQYTDEKKAELQRNADLANPNSELSKQRLSRGRKQLGAVDPSLADLYSDDMSAKDIEEDNKSGLIKNVVTGTYQRQAAQAKAKQDLAESKRKESATANKERTLPAGTAEGLGGASSSYTAVDDITDILNKNKDITGPGAGLLSEAAAKFQMGDRGKAAASLNAELKSRAQIIGTYLEKGKMTDKDVPKYEKMLPAITDSSEVASAKIQNLKRLISLEQKGRAEALRGAGYNTENIAMVKAPELRADRHGAAGENAVASPVSQHPQDSQAVQWAKANPNDPRAAAILKENGF